MGMVYFIHLCYLGDSSINYDPSYPQLTLSIDRQTPTLHPAHGPLY